MSNKITVPDIGDFESVEIIEILVKKGDQIKKNASIVTLESEKSSVEVPSTDEGTVESVSVNIGDKVSKGDVLISLSGNSNQKEEIKKLPVDTENIIKEAESNLVNDKKEITETKTDKKIETVDLPVKKDPVIKVVKKDGDIDPIETNEWLESLSSVLENDGKERAQYLIKQLIEYSYKKGSDLILSRNTPYINTIKPEEQAQSPGDQNLERKIRSLIRWNAAAMVVRANKKNPELGGHIGTFASAATLYDVGMNHFWRAKNNKFGVI